MSWQALDSLRVGHYGVGLLADGEEVDIYRSSETCIWNVANGLPVSVL